MQKDTRIQTILNFIRRDFWRKLVAVSLALLLYMAINQRISEKREKSFTNVPVNVELPSDLFLNINCKLCLPRARLPLCAMRRATFGVSI